ncbi:hypothetical protein P6U16_22505 (plasmid) [Rhizobium sp. 32-5/1]|uniref:hypothetical protein n=1 Tax=Rhizobium sp. 32-5/1 TaxID=3019602 RepID=UPI00240D21B3|nr:hypothetical protein [Rhizobium sp. 32-5/1]WEZ85800.1 hypothetical protein P6U16_22505 [Rhizobium sp. 32-5/1]
MGPTITAAIDFLGGKVVALATSGRMAAFQAFYDCNIRALRTAVVNSVFTGTHVMQKIAK